MKRLSGNGHLNDMRLTTAPDATRGIHVPLRRLALCLDCETCFVIGTGTCPACGSDSWAALARFLERKRVADVTTRARSA